MTELHSIVVPMYNESEVALRFYERLRTSLSSLPDHEIVFVDDGSTDDTAEILRRLANSDSRIRIIRLSRNFGHQTAITAGLDAAVGDTVTVIDADLQDPPEIIPDLVERWRMGADIVFAVRRSRQGESAFKKATASAFYRLLNRLAAIKIPVDSGDFRLMSRKTVRALSRMREQSRYIRGLVAWMGFEQDFLYYERDARAAGETKYPLRKMLKLAADGVVSFSTRPLQLATWLGFCGAMLGLLYGIYVVFLAILTDRPVQGWSSLMAVVLFFGGVQLLTLGIMGAYIGRTYTETQDRPLYLVREVVQGQGELRSGGCHEQSVLPSDVSDLATG